MPTPDTRPILRNLDRRVSAIEQILPTLATKAALERFATKDDLERFATKADLEHFATKDDLAQFRAQMITLLEAVHTKLDQIIEGFASEAAPQADEINAEQMKAHLRLGPLRGQRRVFVAPRGGA